MGRNHPMILFVTRILPKADGHGGSQRAMHLLRCLLQIGPVDLLFIHRSDDADAAGDALAQARPLVGACVSAEIPEWESLPGRWPGLSWHAGLIGEVLLRYCAEAPRFSSRTLRNVADRLPRRHYDVIFAGRLPSARLVDGMLRRRLLHTNRKVVDLDDIMSRFRERQLAAAGRTQGRLWSAAQRIDIRRIRRAEQEVLRGWQAVSVCTSDDVALLRERVASARACRVPNVVARPWLEPERASGTRLLFVGSLAFSANLSGLRAFLQEAWPAIQAAIPDVTLTVVGMLPGPEVADEMRSAGADLHANVPSVEPFYRDCDIVIAPILFGGGTRIKILEAMAYGRPVVATTIGAEGLEVEPDRHMLIADETPAFAEAVIRLSRDPALKVALARSARAHQERHFGEAAMGASVTAMVTGSSGGASRPCPPAAP
jgi:glycosyltransferase involved in cell wall biosynthesis